MIKRDENMKMAAGKGPIGAVFFIAYLGAAVYFVQQSDGFFGFIWALIKAIAWPGILVFQAMQSLQV